MEIDLTRPDDLTDAELDAIIANPERYGLSIHLHKATDKPIPEQVRAILREDVREVLRQSRGAGSAPTSGDPGRTQDS